jgi:hypothetical protein
MVVTGTVLAYERRVHLSATRHLEANLGLLNPAAQRALRADETDDVAVDFTGPMPRASVMTGDGRQVPVHGTDDPLAGAREMVAQLNQQGEPSLLIVIGLGLGYLLDALEQADLSTKVLALEPLPGVTRAMLSRRDFGAWLASGRLTLLVGPDYTGAAEAWRLFAEPDAKPGVIMAPMLGRDFPAQASQAKDVVRQILASPPMRARPRMSSGRSWPGFGPTERPGASSPAGIS